MSGAILWNTRAIPFRAGETVALALRRAGVTDFGAAPTGQRLQVFCGIGQCQGCLVEEISGSVTEACLLPCRDGLRVQSCARPPVGKEGDHG